jgi:hypothetical protein
MRAEVQANPAAMQAETAVLEAWYNNDLIPRLDIFLAWGDEHLDGENCHFLAPRLLHWRTLIKRIIQTESGPVASM